MSTRKPTAKQRPTDRTAHPHASRPQIPADYGVPHNTKGLLPWSHVTERMAQAMHYWICTVDPNGRPHATPVDGLWLDDQLYFGGSPQTRRNRNLAANPAVCVHLESGTDVVMLQGEADLHTPDRAFAIRLAEASAKKYGYAPKPEDYEAGGVHVFHPRVVFAWTQQLADATRWQLREEG
jgi:nitroimidazol reductase NimA-like FMN-containing flavoprotein (pyridoxamine 5'-phosphate oxidase superfamily)